MKSNYNAYHTVVKTCFVFGGSGAASSAAICPVDPEFNIALLEKSMAR